MLVTVRSSTARSIETLVNTAALSMVVVGTLLLSDPACARSEKLDESTVSLATLPAEAQRTHQLIYAGGPFPYRKDGSVFGNRERLLPAQRRGFYLEYTEATPGARNRGARRIVCGGKQPQTPETCFYTSDHYNSFGRIVP